MKDTSVGHSHTTGVYRIRLKGHLDLRWTAWFDGMTLATKSDGTTVLEGPVVDQAALHGLLTKLRDIGLPLLSVTEVEPSPPATATDPGATSASAQSPSPEPPSTHSNTAPQGD